MVEDAEKESQKWTRPVGPEVVRLVFRTKTLNTKGETKDAKDAFKALTKLGEKAVPELNTLLADSRVPDWVKANAKKAVDAIQKQVAMKQ